jgi:RNA polymerase sigma factor (sigma-70 family)
MRRRKEISYLVESLEHLDSLPFSLINSHSPENQIIEKETKQNLLDFLSRLPEIYQKPIFLYYFEELSYQEISKKLNLKINTLKSHILRGKEILKRWIQHENPNLPS